MTETTFSPISGTREQLETLPMETVGQMYACLLLASASEGRGPGSMFMQAHREAVPGYDPGTLYSWSDKGIRDITFAMLRLYRERCFGVKP